MEIRTSEVKDIPVIVDLLKQSLGETLMPKSESYWYWKHVNNPFGKSPVLLAFEQGNLIGVRAFMCWQWTQNDSTISAVRAVDTATHPQHQGKGIFKKLTLQLLAHCKEQGVSFVFNTPNSQSKPGYLKMGWRVAGKFPVRIRPRILSLLRRQFPGETTNPIPAGDESVAKCLGHIGFEALLNGITESNKSPIHTLHTVSSLNWRYAQVPVVSYFSSSVTKGNELKAAAFYRFKQGKMGCELRVADAFWESPRYGRQLKESLLTVADENGATHVTVSGVGNTNMIGSWLLPALRIGPDVTVRQLNDGVENELISFAGWHPSIGDLELF